MKTIYIDSDFKCHVSFGDGLASVETDTFDGKCDAYIEGYRFVPAGSTWMREDGVEFSGEMISPWKDWQKLDDAQREYEQEQYKTLAAETAILSAALDELDAEYQKGVDSL